jgi:hypothetical protein
MGHSQKFLLLSGNNGGQGCSSWLSYNSVLSCAPPHLQMRGMAGYMADLATELARLNNALRGGLSVSRESWSLLGGCKDRMAVCAIMEAGRWLSHFGSFHLQETIKMVMSGLVEMGQGGVWETEKMRHPMPLNLTGGIEQRSWVSGGWTTPCEVLPFTPELEEKIVRSLACELNGLFNLGLGT